MHHPYEASALPYLHGSGKMSELIRTFDWSRTPVGPIERWPHSLKTTVETLLGSRHPMLLWWGPELIQFYNDGYLPFVGPDRHQAALGARGREFWGDTWSIIEPQIDAVMRRGESTWNLDQRIPIRRGGRIKEAFWTYGYSPVRDDDGRIGGVLVVTQETTRYVLNERRLRTLHGLATLTSLERDAHDMARSAIGVIDQNWEDVPFSLCYLLDTDGTHASLAGAAGLTEGSRCAPRWIPIDPQRRSAPSAQSQYSWPIAEVIEQHRMRVLDDVATQCGLPASERWPEPLQTALVFPLLSSEEGRPLGALVLGTSAYLSLDAAYRTYLNAVAYQLGTAIAKAAAETARSQSLMAERSARAERDQLLAEANAARVRAEAAEARLVDVFQQSPTFLCVVRGKDHTFELVNEAYYNIVGHRDVIGKPLSEALPEIEGQGFREVADEVIRTGKPYIGREVRALLQRTPDAPLEERFIDFIYQPLTESDGSRTGIVMHGSDVTEQVHARRNVERLLRESEDARRALEAAHAAAELAKEEAMRANKAKAEFLAVMSHELRTPLNAIAGYTQVLQMGVHGPVTPEMEEDLARIHRNQAHLTGLINSVLNYAKIEAGSVEYNLAPISLNEMATEVESLVATEIQRRSLTVEMQLYSTPLIARADSEKVRQILLNLLTNATKFTQPGGRITISCAPVEGSRMVGIRVADTGVGIEQEQLRRIFDPFVQVGHGLSTSNEGVGLGLAISRELALGMGGDLRVQSVVGEGTTFTLTLPQALEEGETTNTGRIAY